MIRKLAPVSTGFIRARSIRDPAGAAEKHERAVQFFKRRG
jgi:hypothetical protein